VIGARTLRTALTGLALLLVVPAAAQAHIQVRPAEVAPDDPVKFELLVPGEKEAATTKVEMQVPEGVYPFSFEDVPGWKRQVFTKKNGAMDRIVWTGKLAPDGLLDLTFLAGTPEKEGTISWKALQYYDDGSVVRWVGAPGTETPAASTAVRKDVAKQNAGGESGGDEGTAASGDDASGSDDTSGSKVDASSEDGGTDWLSLSIAIAALVVALAALLVRRKRA
jgi:uncharacterized protein YcnI